MARRRRLTEEQEIILDAWYQFGYRTVWHNRVKIYHGGLSSLGWQYAYLRRHKLIRRDGLRYGDYPWACGLLERGQWGN